jgi:serine/threonine-protein kinase
VSSADASDYARVKALFNEVCDLPDAAAQRARLAELGASAALAERVIALAGFDEQATRISAPVAGMLASAAAPELQPGERLRAWTLLAELGRGGMGQVFLAERSDGHYQQRAAIKLLRGLGGALAPEQLARERQILANLNHPHIARLIDGGATPAGQPYLVMDYVDGERIDSYLAALQPGLDATLALFTQVAEAVAYAHRQMVVHCDIKPGNVLVGTDGRAMLLDFGIAQLQDQRGSTETGPQALTPRYASPEQIAGAPATAASDIYSLGRMLDELLRLLRPPAPRENEWQAIVAKACAHRPQDRYLSVDALLADLRRFRSHRPLQALPGQRLYRAAKFVRRRWPWLLVAGGAAALSLAFTLRLVQERDRALAAELLAQQEAETARQVGDFLVSLFEGADPRHGGNAELSAASLVDRGRERLDSELAGQPQLQASMKGVLARVYENMGRPRNAVSLYEQALAMEQARPDADPLRRAALLTRLAVTLSNDSQGARAVPLAREALALRQARLPADALELAETHNNLGLVLVRVGALPEAREHLERALEIRRARHGEQHLDVAIALQNLGLLESRAEQPQLAEQHYRQALAIKQRLLAPEHPSMLVARQNLASALLALGRADEATTLLTEVLAARRRLHGPDSAEVGSALNELGVALQDGGRLREALSTYGQALALDERIAGRSPASIAIVVNNLGTALEDLGDPAAEQRYRESLALRRSQLKPDDPSVARAEHNLGRWLMRAGQLDEAGPLLRQAAQTRRARLPATHNERADSAMVLAELALQSGDSAAAQAELALVVPDQLRPPRRIALLRMQGLLLAAQGRKDEALQRLAAALQQARQQLHADHPQLLRLRLDLARLQIGAGQAAQARATLADAAKALAELHAQAPQRRVATALLTALDERGQTKDKP